MIGPLNLATRPFRNERLPAALLTLGLLVSLGVTVKHAFVVADLMSVRSVALEREVTALDAEAQRLRSSRSGLATRPPDLAAARQWALLSNLVDRRAFVWTDLFARLEQVLPPGVHLVSIAPVIQKGQVILDFTAVGRSFEENLDFVKALQARKDFADVFPTGLGKVDEGSEIGLSLRYVPEGRVPLLLTGAR